MWSNEEKRNFAFKYTQVCKMYNFTVDTQFIGFVIEALKNYNSQDCCDAVMTYTQNSKNKFYPRPADLIEIISPTFESRDVAIVLSRKIDLAVKKYGWVWSQGYYSAEHNKPYFTGGNKTFWTWEEAVIEELGQEGLNYINSMGGWQKVRDSANELNEGVFIAQTRDLLQSSSNLNKQNIDVTKISFRNNPPSGELEKFDIKKIMPKLFS